MVFLHQPNDVNVDVRRMSVDDEEQRTIDVRCRRNEHLTHPVLERPRVDPPLVQTRNEKKMQTECHIYLVGDSIMRTILAIPTPVVYQILPRIDNEWW